jgi:hypothetical protein
MNITVTGISKGQFSDLYGMIAVRVGSKGRVFRTDDSVYQRCVCNPREPDVLVADCELCENEGYVEVGEEQT